jgi:flagellar biosynthetic protein FliR
VIDVTPLIGLGLLLVRPGALILAAPTFGGTYAPAQVKIGLTLLLAIALAPVVTVPPVGSTVSLVGFTAHEIGIGVALGMSIRTLVAAAELGGHLAGFQVGLSYSAIVDPQSGVRNNILATLYANIATISFLATNAHHAFLRGLRDSYTALPIGLGHLSGSIPQAVTSMLGLIFTFGVRLAAPLVVVLVITEVALALIARAAPAFNLMAVGAPVRLIIGLILLGVVAPAAVSVLGGLSHSVLQLGMQTASAFR